MAHERLEVLKERHLRSLVNRVFRDRGMPKLGFRGKRAQPKGV